MSTAFMATVQALGNDPELRTRVMSATSAEERAEILRAAGVPVPNHAEVSSGLLGLADVAGAGTTATKKNQGGGGGTPGPNGDDLEGMAAAAASAGAAA